MWTGHWDGCGRGCREAGSGLERRSNAAGQERVAGVERLEAKVQK